jgi:uncharacterized iron-regulated protein/outer membrane lipoprotein-sorting protein
MKPAILLLSLMLMSLTVHAQIPFSPEQFRVFDGKGKPSTLEEVITAAGGVDVIFFGEFHDDTVGHAIQAEAFKRIVERYHPGRTVVLSLEMFERDVQVVLDEYLSSLITEQHFLSSSRPWTNYRTDYRPLVELAKEKRLKVIAANAPRRYVNMVSRGGRAALAGLSKDARKWLPPLPYAEASEAYSKKFKALMGGSGEARMGLDNILSSQSLWDASMAYWITQGLKKERNALVVHLNGGFHTESRLGTVEHFLKYRKKGKALVVTMRYEDDFTKFDPAKHTDLGDYVMLTKKIPKGGNALSEILRRTGENARLLTSARARVKMVRSNVQLGATDTADGMAAYVAKKGTGGLRVRVDWSKPNEQFTIVGDQFALYRPRLAQAITGRLQPNSKEAAVAAMGKFMNMTRQDLSANYVTTLLGEETLVDGAKAWHLRFEPRTKEPFKDMEAWIDADGMPRQFKVNGRNGDETIVHLSQIQKNVNIPGENFRLHFPPGTKIIRT